MKLGTIAILGVAAYIGYRYARRSPAGATSSTATTDPTVLATQVSLATPLVVAVPDEGAAYFDPSYLVGVDPFWTGGWSRGGGGHHHHGGGGHGGHHGGHH